ncbi:cyclase-associated protein [Epithele typhae]|uniref:cyclase-associated protein n=1 Tax=Epithele typhae TaxID=378194 RepID=UPI002007DA46|nr:cyclase-associated protein [Epithele typhae]KAH9923947.1 cyclase-associated protein [Epithele typhae]
MASGGLHSLATIIKRLEATTSRLEDLASLATSYLPPSAQAAAAAAAASPSSANAEPTPVPPPAAPATASATPQSIVAFDERVIGGKLKPFLVLTKEFAPPLVNEQVRLYEAELMEMRNMVVLFEACTKPDAALLAQILTPLDKASTPSLGDWADHLKMITAAAPSAGWVTQTKDAYKVVQDAKEQTQYYGNPIIMKLKENWVQDFFPSGPTWNAKGVSVDQFKAGPCSRCVWGAVSDVFNQINKGADITKGLRKVDKSEMTHKNPALRAGSTVPASTPSSSGESAPKRPVKPTKPQALSSKKPPSSRWRENQENVVPHIVNIYGCKDSTIVIKGKVNAVNLVNCKETSVLVESVISSVSVTGCPGFGLQITGKAPTIQLDSTDTGTIYLSPECLDVEITTAKCSAININVPMFRTTIVDGKLVTTAVEHAG